MQTECTLDRLALGLSRPLDPVGMEAPFEEGISTRPISTTLQRQKGAASRVPRVLLARFDKRLGEPMTCERSCLSAGLL